MKRILSFVLTIAMMLSIIGGVAMTNTENVYARMGKDIYGNPVENTNIYQPTDDPVYYYQPPVDEDGNHDYFGYKIYDDPQEITDEEFFGKWDEIDNKWVMNPYFKYSQYPAMSAVEEAAKAGDYETAKEELLAYYKLVQPERAAMYTTSVPAAYVKECLEGLSRNIFGYNMISAMNIGKFFLPANEFETVEVPVHSSIVKDAVGSYTELSVEIASGDKFWTTAQIYTKDAANASVRPKLTANVNGIYTEFPATKDAVVVAGNSGDTNFGFDEIAEIQEHGTFDNIDSSMGSYDDNTRRLYIAFDISSLKSTDNVTNMKIVLTGRNVITEDTKYKFADEHGKPYEGEADRDKLMWAVWYKDSAWQEDTLTWNTNTIMDKMYFSCNDMEAWDYITSSGTGVKGKVCDFHRDNQLGYLRNAWMYYKDERYAYTYIRQEMALINSIGFETNVMNSLDMSTHANGLISSFYGFMESKYYTADVCTTWLKFLCQLANWQTYTYYGTSTNNWATFASGSVYNTCARFPELTASDDWYEETLKEHDRTLSGFTFEDGMCIEMSHNYKSTILSTMSTPLAAMRNSGYKSPFNEELYEEIYNIVMSLVYTSGPYFGGFNTNDGYDPYTSYKSTFKTWYQNLFSDNEIYILFWQYC